MEETSVNLIIFSVFFRALVSSGVKQQQQFYLNNFTHFADGEGFQIIFDLIYQAPTVVLKVKYALRPSSSITFTKQSTYSCNIKSKYNMFNINKEFCLIRSFIFFFFFYLQQFIQKILVMYTVSKL